VTDTDFDLDDEPVLTAEGEVAAAICGHQVVMQRGDALTADMLDEFHGFVQEELAALLEKKNAEIAYLRAIVNGKFADAAQMRLSPLPLRPAPRLGREIHPHRCFHSQPGPNR
jgi:hypothetical protein